MIIVPELFDLRDDDKFHDRCGVAGILNSSTDVFQPLMLMLFALQHRGQEASGMVLTDGSDSFVDRRGLGLVNEVFHVKTLPDNLKGCSGLGHNRYPTSGDQGNEESSVRNIQPLLGRINTGWLSVAHNGNLVNAPQLRAKLEANGCLFQSDSDTEVILHLIATSLQGTLTEKIHSALGQVKGAYSLIFLTKDSMIGVRDPFGFRPLVLGKLRESFVLVSETCALDIVGAEFVREIEPGEVVTITSSGIESKMLDRKAGKAPCSFEFIYFARPDSVVGGVSVQSVRERMGYCLANYRHIDADLVVPVPDSGRAAAEGFAHQSGIRLQSAMVRSHYIGRTFIDPANINGGKKVKMKFNVVKDAVKGKKIILIDDSIVRGNTLVDVIRLLKNAGAAEIHLCISCPKVIAPCFFGIDTPSADKLLAFRMSTEEMMGFLGVDSLTFLSVEDLLWCCGREHCTGCFTNMYPEEIPEPLTA